MPLDHNSLLPQSAFPSYWYIPRNITTPCLEFVNMCEKIFEQCGHRYRPRRCGCDQQKMLEVFYCIRCWENWFISQPVYNSRELKEELAGRMLKNIRIKFRNPHSDWLERRFHIERDITCRYFDKLRAEKMELEMMGNANEWEANEEKYYDKWQDKIIEKMQKTDFDKIK